MTEHGRILKIYNNVLHVAAEDDVILCKLRGRIKKGRGDRGLVPGDIAAFERISHAEGVIECIEERTNLLQRPRVANLTQIIITVAAASPNPHPLVVSRFLVLAELSGVRKIVLCVNKMDLCQGKPEDFLAEYEEAGYPVLRVSAEQGTGLDELRACLQVLRAQANPPCSTHLTHRLHLQRGRSVRRSDGGGIRRGAPNSSRLWGAMWLIHQGLPSRS